MKSRGSSKKDALIGRATSLEDIVDALAKRGCLNLTPLIDLDACSNLPLAGGGFCDVFQGRLNDGTVVAIKSLRVYDRPGRDNDKQKILKRAAREMYHWSRLKHPNVLPLMGLAIFRGQMSMVSQWVDNGDLMSYIRLKPDSNRVELCVDVCAGLCHIHAEGMVHGDLKAANVMVSSKGVAMIADFGNSQLKDLTLKFTNTTNLSHSVRWTAPELLREDDSPHVSKEADVYAYGMTALETLTGKVPFHGLKDNRIIVLVAYEYQVPSRPDAGISDDLWDVMTSCWIREPAKRPTIENIKERIQTLGGQGGPILPEGWVPDTDDDERVSLPPAHEIHPSPLLVNTDLEYGERWQHPPIPDAPLPKTPKHRVGSQPTTSYTPLTFPSDDETPIMPDPPFDPMVPRTPAHYGRPLSVIPEFGPEPTVPPIPEAPLPNPHRRPKYSQHGREKSDDRSATISVESGDVSVARKPSRWRKLFGSEQTPRPSSLTPTSPAPPVVQQGVNPRPVDPRPVVPQAQIHTSSTSPESVPPPPRRSRADRERERQKEHAEEQRRDWEARQERERDRLREKEDRDRAKQERERDRLERQQAKEREVKAEEQALEREPAIGREREKAVEKEREREWRRERERGKERERAERAAVSRPAPTLRIVELPSVTTDSPPRIGEPPAVVGAGPTTIGRGPIIGADQTQIGDGPAQIGAGPSRFLIAPPTIVPGPSPPPPIPDAYTPYSPNGAGVAYGNGANKRYSYTAAAPITPITSQAPPMRVPSPEAWFDPSNPRRRADAEDAAMSAHARALEQARKLQAGESDDEDDDESVQRIIRSKYGDQSGQNYSDDDEEEGEEESSEEESSQQSSSESESTTESHQQYTRPRRELYTYPNRERDNQSRGSSVPTITIGSPSNRSTASHATDGDPLSPAYEPRPGGTGYEHHADPYVYETSISENERLNLDDIPEAPDQSYNYFPAPYNHVPRGSSLRYANPSSSSRARSTPSLPYSDYSNGELDSLKCDPTTSVPGRSNPSRKSTLSRQLGRDSANSLGRPASKPTPPPVTVTRSDSPVIPVPTTRAPSGAPSARPPSHVSPPRVPTAGGSRPEINRVRNTLGPNGRTPIGKVNTATRPPVVSSKPPPQQPNGPPLTRPTPRFTDRNLKKTMAQVEALQALMDQQDFERQRQRHLKRPTVGGNRTPSPQGSDRSRKSRAVTVVSTSDEDDWTTGRSLKGKPL